MATFAPQIGFLTTSVLISPDRRCISNTARIICSASNFLTGQRVPQNALHLRQTSLPIFRSRSNHYKSNRTSRASIHEASHSEIAVIAEGHKSRASEAGAGAGAGAGARGGRKVVVVGAGWAGLGAAYHLTKQVRENRLTSRHLLTTTEADNRIPFLSHAIGNSNDEECALTR